MNVPIAFVPTIMWEVGEKPNLECMKSETNQWKILPITTKIIIQAIRFSVLLFKMEGLSHRNTVDGTLLYVMVRNFFLIDGKSNKISILFCLWQHYYFFSYSK
jgi:hypothetical protein